MPDIFLSYAREDAAFVERLAAALQTVGYSCWWDRQLVSGARYLAETEAQLQSAKAVVVVWSRTSINSHWVADEAAVGRDGDRLAALSFDGSMPPLGFRQFQVTDFAGWRGGTDEAPFQSLLRGLERSVPVSSEGLGRTASSPPKTSTRPRWWLPTIASVGALLVGAVLWMLLRPAPAPTGNAASAIGSTAGSVGATDFPRDPELRRAVGLAQQVNAIREDLLLAEEIVERAVE
ncbi:MAG: toll/interleukin-1 receptor domain-containing protein, partial [Gammaproteobacteria bacterium]